MNNLEKVEEFNKAYRKALNNNTHEEFLKERGFANGCEAFAYLVELLYGEENDK